MDQINGFEKPTSTSAAGTLSTSDGDDSESDWMGVEDEAALLLKQDDRSSRLPEYTNLESKRERFVDCDEEDEPKDVVQAMRRKVSWGNIQMHMHPVIPGDHPDTVEGPPITIDWNCFAVHELDIDGYEAKRPPRMKVLGHDMRLCPVDRQDLLRRVGIKDEEISAATAQAQFTRKQRLRTRELCRLGWNKIEEVKEKVVRSLAKAINPQRRVKLITRY